MRKGRRTVLVFIMGAGLLWAGAVGAADKKLESCGNGVVDAGEQCDWTNLNGQTCASQGFVGGTLACTPGQCTFDMSGCSAVRFVDNRDGTITDFQTRLMWEKKDDAGGLHDKDLFLTWPSALSDWLPELNGRTNDPGTQAGFAGYTDWRIPTIVELQTLIDVKHTAPAVDPVFNTECTSGCSVTSCSCTAAFAYWSSSTFANGPSSAWIVAFFNGYENNDEKGLLDHVRAVRGGR